MSHLLFLDESGVDRHQSPYEVLAGVAIHDRCLWDLICKIRNAEVFHFGQRITDGLLELKAKKLLKKKTFRMAGQADPIDPARRRDLARSCLLKGSETKGTDVSSSVTRLELAALAQAKIAFVKNVFGLCIRHDVRCFASMVPMAAPRVGTDFLRKDYSYLFERFYYYLEELGQDERGLVIFDELERSSCHMLVDQMSRYFLRTATGQKRSSRIIPEPFFVHSELTTAIQIADLVAYVICWGVRFGSADAPVRAELQDLASLVLRMRHRTVRDIGELADLRIWSLTVIDDLRPRAER